MKWVYIEDISNYKDKDVEIRGWVYNKRSSGKVRFLLIRDGTGILQGTIFSPDLKNSALFLRSEPEMAVFHEERNAVGFWGNRIIFCNLDDL